MATYANPNTLDASNSIDPLLRPSKTPYPMGDGTTGTVTLRDYQHAARLFVDGNYQLSPKYGFLFYVEFDFNPLITNVSNNAAQEMGMIVKNVGLPKFSIDTKVHNAYNRKNIVQNSIKYDPVSITFHDDQADNVRSFWYDYYSFFYRDSDYNDATYQLITKYQERPSFEWGYTPRPVASYNATNAYQSYQYIQAIRIYSLYQKNFSEYELINPIITNFQHGEHNVSEGSGLLEHKMTVQFETVKYYSGYVTANTAGGFIDLHYDNTPSPISPAAGPNIVSNGAGGYAATPDSVLDLANYNLSTAGGSVVPLPNSGALSSASSFASLFSSVLGAAAGSATNIGGFSLPAIGSLVSGISSGAIVGQQLSAAAVSLAGGAASTLAGGIISGITGGSASTSPALGMLASAATNPAAALATVASMATGGLMTAATQGINSLTSSSASSLSSSLSSSGIVQGISTGITNLTTAIGDEAKAIKSAVSELTSGIGGALSDAGSAISDAASSAAGAVSDVASTVAEGASSVASSVSAGISNAVSDVSSAVGGTVSDITQSDSSTPGSAGDLGV